jgi:hypothetical protein
MNSGISISITKHCRCWCSQSTSKCRNARMVGKNVVRHRHSSIAGYGLVRRCPAMRATLHETNFSHNVLFQKTENHAFAEKTSKF